MTDSLASSETKTNEQVIIAGRLEDWFITEGDRIAGFIYGHANLPDGSVVVTTRVVEPVSKSNEWAITSQGHYVLGKHLETRVEENE